MKMSDKHKQFIANILLPLFLLSGGLIWKFYFISYRDISLDEPFTVFHAQQSLWHILSMPANGEPNPPLFMVLLHFWIKIFGTDPSSVRFLPLIFSSLTAVFLYFSGKRFFGLWAGLLASGLFLFSNFHFFHGIEARTYSLLSLAVASSLYFFLRIVKEPVSGWVIAGLVISNLIMVYSHYFGWLIVMVQFICITLYLKERNIIRNVILAVGLTVLAYLPFFYILVKQFLKSRQGTWVEAPASSREYLYQLHNFFNHAEVLNGVLWILITGLVFLFFRKAWKSLSKELIIIFIWWFLPFTLMFLVSFKMPVFITRYLLFNSIGLYLFVGVMVYQLFSHNKFLISASVVILLAMMANRMRILPDDFSYRESQKAAAYVKEMQKPEDMVVLYPYYDELGFAYYYDRSVFENTKDFSNELKRKHIIPVWGVDMVKSVVDVNSAGRIIYHLNGPAPGEDDGIFKFFKENFRLTDSVGFQQTFTIAIFERNK